MGCTCSSLKVCGHLEVVGQCGGVDRLTLCLPCSRKKGGRRLLGKFSFPSSVDGPGQHRSVRRTLVPIGKIAKKDGTIPVRVDFLAGESLVVRREIPLADLLAGLKANTIGRRSSIFFSLKAGEDDTAAITVYHSKTLLLDQPRTIQEEQNEPPTIEEHASLPPQAGDTDISLPPNAVDTDPSDTAAGILIPEVTYHDLTPKVTIIDLVDDKKWTTPQAQPFEERSHTPQADQTTEDSLTPEVIDRDLGDGERWVPPQAHLRRRREEPRGRSTVGAREGSVVLQPSIPSPSKQGKEAPRCGKGEGGGRGCLCGTGPCLVVDSLLQCTQVMATILLVYRLYLDWF